MSPPANDDFASRITLTGTSGREAADNTGATVETGEATPSASGARQRTIWYELTPPTGYSLLYIDLSASAVTDTVLGVYTGSAVNALTEVASDDDSGTGSRSKLSTSVTPGITYKIQVGGFGTGNQGSLTIDWAVYAPSGSSVVPCPTLIAADFGSDYGSFGTAFDGAHWYADYVFSGTHRIDRFDYPDADNMTSEVAGFTDGQHYIWNPQTDGTSIFWLEQDPFDTNTSRVMRATLGGGTPSVLFTKTMITLRDLHSLVYHPTTGLLYFVDDVENGDGTHDVTLYSMTTAGGSLTSLYNAAGVDIFGGEWLDPGGALPGVTATSIWGTTHADTPFNGVHAQLWRFDVGTPALTFGAPMNPHGFSLVGTPQGKVLTRFLDLPRALWEVEEDFSFVEWACTDLTEITGNWTAFSPDLSKITFRSSPGGSIYEFGRRRRARVGRVYA